MIVLERGPDIGFHGLVAFVSRHLEHVVQGLGVGLEPRPGTRAGPLSCLISVIMRPALAPSFQKPGSAVRASFSAILFSIATASKTPPDIEYFRAERGDGSCYVVEHYFLRKLARYFAGPRGVAHDDPAPFVVFQDGYGEGSVDGKLIKANGIVGIGHPVDVAFQRRKELFRYRGRTRSRLFELVRIRIAATGCRARLASPRYPYRRPRTRTYGNGTGISAEPSIRGIWKFGGVFSILLIP